ncbi:late competence development ComFB family protein [Lacrimispora aerotolerans]|uniref:late competence development ComFB family protein n=1 Tax=Lacrimispora aerotolerans TaxID=36832 RepID=UPI00140BDBD6|nr:late competence development ComFB family protein [Lacrimispora aerotolerans]
MNLLAGDEPETSKSEAAKENQAASLNTDSSETIKELTVLAHKASIQTQEGPLTPSPISIIDMSSSSPDPVSEMIRQQLEEEEGITTESSRETAIEANVTETGDTESEKAVDENARSEKTEAGKNYVEKAEIEGIEDEETIAEKAVTEDIEAEETTAEKTIAEGIESEETTTEKAITEGIESTGIGSEELKTETPIDDRKKNAVAGDSNESNANSTGSTEALGNFDSGSDVKGNIGYEEENAPMILTASEVKVIEADFEEPKRNPSLEPEAMKSKESALAPETEAMKSKDSASIPEPEKATFKYLNVMEHVVQSKVHEYAAKFDTCCCGHCIADITALTLTNLPPKYVVVKPPTASPLLNFYMNRYSQQVIVEITKACFTVKQNPHH